MTGRGAVQGKRRAPHFSPLASARRCGRLVPIAVRLLLPLLPALGLTLGATVAAAAEMPVALSATVASEMPVAIPATVAAEMSVTPPAAAATDTSVGPPPVEERQLADATLALDPVTVEGQTGDTLGTRDAASQGRVAGSLLQDIPLLRPGNVLETVPGLVVTQHSGDGKANQYFLRGYNLDHGTDFATFLDGVPINLPSNAHGQGYADLNPLIPELVDHIDYVKGPYFAELGDFSAAGAARIHYRDRLEQGLADFTVGAYGYRRSLFAGSTDLSPAGAAGDRGGPVLLGALELQNNDGPWAVAEDLHKVNALLRLGIGTAARGGSVEAGYYDARWNATDQVPLALIQAGQIGRYAALDPSDGGATGRQVLSGEWHEHDDDGYTRLAAYAAHQRLHLYSDFSYDLLRPLTGDQFEQWEQRDRVGADLARGVSQRLLGHDSITEAGLELRHDQVHVGLRNTERRIAFATVSDDRVGVTETGAYVQNSIAWTDTLRTLAGAREQRVAMDLHDAVLAQNTGSTAAARFLPRLSLILGPWRRTEFFANWGQGFHSNDARGVLDRIDPTTGQAASRVPALVGASGAELGLRTEALPGLRSSLAIWRLASASELVYNADSDLGSTTPNGASRRQGIEWNNHLQIGRHLQLDADLAWTHARYAAANDNRQAGDLIPNAVAQVGLLRASLNRVGPWSADVEARFIGAYPLTQDGALTAPSSLVTNLRLQREVSPGLELALDVLNAFDRHYEDIAYAQAYQVGASAPPVASGVTVHPGEPRELRLTLRLRY